MADDANFEADLNAILEGTEEQTSTQGSQGQTQPAPVKIKAGGREFSSPDELAKTYDALLKDHTKKSQSLSRGAEWIKFGENLDKHPELRDDLVKRIDEYNARRAAGQSKATAEHATGVNPQMVERLQRMESQFADIQLERELSGLRSKYSLSSEDEKGLLEAAAELTEKYGNLPLDVVYRHWAFDRSAVKARGDGERAAVESAQKKGKAFVGGSQASGVTPSKKPPTTNEEWSKALSDELDKYGLHD